MPTFNRTLIIRYRDGGTSLTPIQINDDGFVEAIAGTFTPRATVNGEPFANHIVLERIEAATAAGHKVEIINGTAEYDARASALLR